MGDKIKYMKGYKYQLHETYSVMIPIKPEHNIVTEYIELSAFGLLTIKEGYAWDGPSGPTIDTKTSMRGALVHDSLYQLLREKLLDKSLRPQCDQIAHDIWVEDGMYEWRAALWKRELEKFAGYAADPKNKKEVLIAP